MPDTLHFFFFFFNDPAPTEIYTLSLHAALPICDALVDGQGREPRRDARGAGPAIRQDRAGGGGEHGARRPLRALRWHGLRHHLVDDRTDRKSTRLNSSHLVNSYAVFCLKNNKR